MSLGSLLAVVAAIVTSVIPPQSETSHSLALSALDLAAENSIMALHVGPMIGQVVATRQPDSPVTSRFDAPPRPELVVYVGNRRSGPQLELGAMGGGRADAPSLVHLGFGFNF